MNTYMYISIYDISVMAVRALGYMHFETFNENDYRRFAENLGLFNSWKFVISNVSMKAVQLKLVPP